MSSKFSGIGESTYDGGESTVEDSPWNSTVLSYWDSFDIPPYVPRLIFVHSFHFIKKFVCPEVFGSSTVPSVLLH